MTNNFNELLREGRDQLEKLCQTPDFTVYPFGNRIIIQETGVLEGPSTTLLGLVAGTDAQEYLTRSRSEVEEAVGYFLRRKGRESSAVEYALRPPLQPIPPNTKQF